MALWNIKERYDLARANDIKGTRGFVSAGQDPSGTSAAIDMLIIETQGSAVDFGDITIATNQLGNGNAGSSTRGFVKIGGENSNGYYTTPCEVIDTKGGTGVIATSFGDLTVGASAVATCSTQIRAVMGGGATATNSGDPRNVIDYFTISSFGNATDFGDLTVARSGGGGMASPTRGIFCGGFVHPSTIKNEIDFITIASTGNASDFGDISSNRRHSANGSNQTRGIIAGGQVPGNTTQMDHITISSTGNSIEFGDLTAARQPVDVSNQIHLLACGGSTTNTIDKISFSSLGNSVDFGDLTKTFNSCSSASDGHGGLDNNNYIDAQRPSVNFMPGNGKALICSGQLASGSGTVDIDILFIPTLGNARNFGDTRFQISNGIGCAASLTRGIFASGYYFPASPYYTAEIQAIEFASEGNTFDFGDVTQERYGIAYGNVGNTTRGLFMGGYAPSSPYIVNIIDYITIATAGNATDFGDLTSVKQSPAAASNNTRGINFGGVTPSNIDIIDYVTIASTGNALDFGDSSVTRSNYAGAASTVRAVAAGGGTPSNSDVIDYVTIASTGDATDFGDLTQAGKAPAPAANGIRAVFAGRHTPGKQTTMDYITIASTGNAADYGDLKAAASEKGGLSNAHAGLQN